MKLLPLLILLAGCTSSPISGRKGVTFLSEGQENSMGAQSYEEILKKEKETTNPKQKAQVEEIVRRLVAVANKPDYKWEVRTLVSDAPNAFCLPGGKMAVYTGIFPYAENEAGLAAVIGHEIAHALARHGGQRVSQGMLTQLGLTAASIVGFRDNPNKAAIIAGLGAVANVGILMPFGRSHELEADEIGLILMAKAGYDPREAPRFWDRMSKAHGGKEPPAFLSTHPNSSTRKEKLTAMLPKALENYKNAPKKLGLGQPLIK